PVGSTVDFTVSSGQVTMPDVVGQALTAANSLLQADAVQLVPNLTPDYTCDSQAGSPVTKQSLAPGDVPQKSEVELTYCAG
ncbi:MAG: PASTA domain-containing protein, partial [Cryobacterium sp.]